MNQGKLPAFVNSLVQYGPRLKGLMVYLMEGQLLPSERARELLEEVIGCGISEGTSRLCATRQKISGTFRSLEGAQQFCRIRGYISTLRKQGIQVLDALRLVFMETPFFPSLQPE